MHNNNFNNYDESYNVPSSTQQDQAGCFTVGIAFLIPLIGLVLYLIWYQTRPNSAKSIAIAAIIGFIVDIIIYISMFASQF